MPFDSANPWRFYAAPLAAAILARLAFAALAPTNGGDWDTYAAVAENILRGCGVSLSLPASGACVPSFGANHGPGFPAFVALVWALSGHSDAAIRIAQILLYALAAFWLMRAALRLDPRPSVGLAVGWVLALSPLQIAWPRYLQTETLALATTIFVFAELVLSLAERRLRIVSLGIAFTLAVAIRLDGVLLAAPIAVAAFALHRPAEAIRRGILVALIAALPVGAWTARNIAHGISPLPPEMITPGGAKGPVGYLAWGRSWVTEEYQRQGWAWPVTRFVYDGIVIDDAAYDSPAERAMVESWLAELATHKGRAFPAAIDRRFAALAEERIARDRLRYYLLNPLRRAAALWSNPFSSFGWPFELPGDFAYQARLRIVRDGPAAAFDLALRFPVAAATKGLTAVWRYALIGLALVAVTLMLTRRFARGAMVAALAIAYAAARTAFFAATNNVETRYMVEIVPALELLAVLLLVRRQGSENKTA